jgi:hypothetical protein
MSGPADQHWEEASIICLRGQGNSSQLMRSKIECIEPVPSAWAGIARNTWTFGETGLHTPIHHFHLVNISDSIGPGT